MTAVEERVDRLEESLASFIEESGRFRAENRESIRQIRESIRQIRESNARTDEQLLRMQQQADRERQQAEKRWLQDRELTERQWTAIEKQRQKEREEAEKERRDFNRRMAELSDSMGTLVEDMVVPNAERIAAQIFGDDPVVDVSQRVRRKRGGETMELDLLAAGTRNVMVVESKRRLRPGDTARFLLKLTQLAKFFPEYAGHRVVPVLASVTIEPSMVANLTKRKTYGLAFGSETMELVNLGQF